MPKSRNSYTPNHENSIGDGGAIKSFNVTLSPLSSPNSACDDTTTTISDPHYPLTINGSNNSEPMSEINQLDLNQKLKGKKTNAYGNNDDVNPSFIHRASSSSSRGADLSDHAAKEMLKTYPVEHACPTKESLIWMQQNLQRYDDDFPFKTFYGSSGYEKFFEKVVLKPQGGVGRGIRIVTHNDNSNNEPIRNNINPQHHHIDDPDNNNQKKVIDDVLVNDGEDGRIQSLPYKKNRPYTCSKCMAVFETSQNFAAHISSHYKHESRAERMKRQMAKMMRRSKKRTVLEHQQQHIKNFRGGGGGSALQVNVEDQAHHNNNYDAPPAILPKSRNSYSPNHENGIGDGGAIKSFNVTFSPLSSPNSACDDTTTTISDPHYPLTINGNNNSKPMSEINQLDLNQKLKEKKTNGYGNNDYVNPSFIHRASSSSSRGASMSDHAAKEMLKTHQVEHEFPTKESLSWTRQNLKRYDHDFPFKTINGSSGYEKFFEKVVLKPQGGVGRGIRIVTHNDNSNNEPIRNNINPQHHHLDDPDNNNQKKVIDDVIVNDGEDGRI
ncbi:hypothetical protein Ahy_B08g090333 [Arachis hypogaea]|uniref:C2H2-type domain-containing protein n=1 Tax=Arachis hypogaea TaxID=3818 RepID=A0A444Y022_ARAHY|nr:hypothetical protein Ahy_B08g090333 [Arachis hypogaea]